MAGHGCWCTGETQRKSCKHNISEGLEHICSTWGGAEQGLLKSEVELTKFLKKGNRGIQDYAG